MHALSDKLQADPTRPGRTKPGVLVLVVGPSGAGKDSLIDVARARLSCDPRFVFPSRVITRGEEPTERHVSVSPEHFTADEAAGRYFLTWRSHGLAYAIPAAISAALTSGAIVVVNVSRTVIHAAESLIDAVVVLHVTAPPAARAARIRARGREDDDAQVSRLERSVAVTPLRSPVIEVANDGALEDASACFMQALLGIASGRATASER